MTAPTAKVLVSITAVALTAACAHYYEIPIETPIKPKLDVSAFQRVLVAGFIAGGIEDVDANVETTRLLRSQLRTKSELRVIDADTLPLMEVAASDRAKANGGTATPLPPIKEEKDLEPYQPLFANVGYWKQIGEDSTGRAQIRIEAWQLPELAMLSVDVGDSAATRLGSGDDTADGGIAVPVVPEVC